jgi:hypothetical protein
LHYIFYLGIVKTEKKLDFLCKNHNSKKEKQRRIGVVKRIGTVLSSLRSEKISSKTVEHKGWNIFFPRHSY